MIRSFGRTRRSDEENRGPARAQRPVGELAADDRGRGPRRDRERRERAGRGTGGVADDDLVSAGVGSLGVGEPERRRGRSGKIGAILAPLNAGAGLPVAPTENAPVPPPNPVCGAGCATMKGIAARLLTVTATVADVVVPPVPVAVTR